MPPGDFLPDEARPIGRRMPDYPTVSSLSAAAQGFRRRECYREESDSKRLPHAHDGLSVECIVIRSRV
jgi:hypothetical protein